MKMEIHLRYVILITNTIYLQHKNKTTKINNENYITYKL